MTARQIAQFTDAAGSQGCGDILGRARCTRNWPESSVARGLTKNITLLELFSIVVAMTVWQERLRT